MQHKFKRQLSCDITNKINALLGLSSITICLGTRTPSSLTLQKEARQQRAMSMCQTPYSPQIPSLKVIDAMLCNTFGGTPSPLSQQFNGGDDSCGKRWYEDESSVYDTLSKKQTLNEEKEVENIKDSVEKEDCYVLMQSNAL